jgi:cation:H+ antiporter
MNGGGAIRYVRHWGKQAAAGEIGPPGSGFRCALIECEGSNGVNNWFYDTGRLALGVLLAWGGGEMFVKGMHGVAVSLRIPPRLVGVTIGAFATSAPELVVAVGAALSGVPGISLGDLTGSNVVNIALILAAALLFSPLPVAWRSVARDYVVALAVPLIIGAVLWDGRLSRADGAILLAAFLAWMWAVLREGLRERREKPADGTRMRARVVWWLAAGLAVLIAAGHFIVDGARGIALRFGMSEFLVGATVVAVSTSTPELATTIVARLKGHHDLGFANILGSNIFNGLFIAAVVALVAPFPVPVHTVAPALVAGLVTTLACVPLHGRILQGQGWFLLALYLVYLLVIPRLGAPLPSAP